MVSVGRTRIELRQFTVPPAAEDDLPDLVRFWPAERRYELIEVKGPGDRLQDNQIRWLEYCAQHGMPVRVLDVRWADDALASGAGAAA